MLQKPWLALCVFDDKVAFCGHEHQRRSFGSARPYVPARVCSFGEQLELITSRVCNVLHWKQWEAVTGKLHNPALAPMIYSSFLAARQEDLCSGCSIPSELFI